MKNKDFNTVTNESGAVRFSVQHVRKTLTLEKLMGRVWPKTCGRAKSVSTFNHIFFSWWSNYIQIKSIQRYDKVCFKIYRGFLVWPGLFKERDIQGY